MSKELAKAKTPEVNKNDERISRLEKVVGFLQRKLETQFGVDFDGDGKIGSARISVMAGIALLSFSIASMALTPLASTNSKWVVTGEQDTNVIADVDYSGNLRVAGAISAVPTGSGSVTSTLATTTSAVDSYPIPHKTVITLDATPLLLTATAASNTWGSVKLFDFPAGRILVQGVTVDGIAITTDTNSLAATGGGDFALGTVAASTNTLAGTMVDLCPSTSIDTLTNIVNSALAASAQFDGTSTAKDMYLNWGIDQGDQDPSEISTNSVDGVITVHWLNLGDY